MPKDLVATKADMLIQFSWFKLSNSRLPVFTLLITVQNKAACYSSLLNKNVIEFNGCTELMEWTREEKKILQIHPIVSERLNSCVTYGNQRGLESELCDILKSTELESELYMRTLRCIFFSLQCKQSMLLYFTLIPPEILTGSWDPILPSITYRGQL